VITREMTDLAGLTVSLLTNGSYFFFSDKIGALEARPLFF